MNIAHKTDIKVRWLFVDKDNNDIDFTPVKNVKVLIRHSRYVNTTYEPRSLSIVNGKINFEIPTEEIKLPGIYHAEMMGVWQTEGNSDGDQKLFVRYLGAFAISNMGCSCHYVKLTSRICLENCSGSQSVNILNSRWGDIVGNIQDQDDLMVLFDGTKHICQWGQISGDILEQEDIVELVRYLVKKYSGSGSSGSDGNGNGDNGDGSDTFSIRASSNDTTMGTVFPTIKTVEKGDSLTITATAKTGYYILSWDEVADVVFSGVGDSSGQAFIESVQRDMTLKCNFAKIPEYGISPTSITLTGAGTIIENITLFTDHGCTIQGAVLDNEGSYKLPWGSNHEDYLTIGFEQQPTTGTQKIWVKSTKNSGQSRTKSITFVEKNTNRTVSLNVLQDIVKKFTVTGSVTPTAAGTLKITKTPTAGVVQDGQWDEGYLGFIAAFTPAAGYGMTAGNDGIFDLTSGAEVLLIKGNTYQTNKPVNKNVTLLVRASKAISTERYKLTTGTAGTGSGRITSVSPSSSDGYYDAGRVVTLTANGGDSSNDYFNYWLVNGVQYSGRTIQVTMDENKTATAYFRYEDPGTPEPNYYTVELSVRYGDSSAATLYGASTYKEGDTVTISATPAGGKEFVSWVEDISSFSNPHSFVITKNMNIQANMRDIPKDQYILRLNCNIAGAGTVLSTGNSAKESIIATYDANSNIEIEVFENPGYKFTHWSGSVTQGWQNGNPLTVRMDSDRTITANFEVVPENTRAYSIEFHGKSDQPGEVWPPYFQFDVYLMFGDWVNTTGSPNAGDGIRGHVINQVAVNTLAIDRSGENHEGTFLIPEGESRKLYVFVRAGGYVFGNGSPTSPYVTVEPTFRNDHGEYDNSAFKGYDPQDDAAWYYEFDMEELDAAKIRCAIGFIDPYARNE